MATVEALRVHRIGVPLARVMRSGIHLIDEMHNVVVEAICGPHVGVGYTFAFREAEAVAVMALAADLSSGAVGTDPDLVRERWQAMWRQTNFLGHAGAAVMALSAVDTALWDLRAQTHGIPLHRLLGGHGVSPSVYVSGGSLDLSTEDLVGEALAARDDEFVGYKLRVGGPDLAADLARVEAVRAAVGPGFALMADANQAWDRPTARRALDGFADVGLAWVEEPIVADDLDGLAELRRRSHVPIAAGESVYGPDGLRGLMEDRAIDVLQPDLMRSGGVTAVLDITALAAAHRLPVSAHLFCETSAHVLAAASTATWLEYLPGWFEHLFGPPAIVAGAWRHDDDPGLGIALDPNVLERHGRDRVELGEALERT